MELVGQATALQVLSWVAEGEISSLVPTAHAFQLEHALPVPKKPVLQAHECAPGPVREQVADAWQSSVPARHGLSRAGLNDQQQRLLKELNSSRIPKSKS